MENGADKPSSQFTFTTVMVTVNQVATNNSNYLQPGEFEKMTPEEVKNAVFGSKMVFVMENNMLATTWLCKACVLFILHYLTWVHLEYGQHWL